MVKLKLKLRWFVISYFTLSISMASVYDVGDSWKLVDWNGAINGGHYNVILLQMHASWCEACYTGNNGQRGYEHQNYEDNDHVIFFIAFSDPNVPYSCTEWRNIPDGGGFQIVHDALYELWGLFEYQTDFPSTVWIDHEMCVYDMMNIAGSWSMSSRIDDMLEACGNLCASNNNIYVPEEYNNIQSAIENSHTGDTIWIAPGTYSGDSNIDLDFDGKNITLISESGPEATIIDCENNERGISFWSGEDSTTDKNI